MLAETKELYILDSQYANNRNGVAAIILCKDKETNEMKSYWSALKKVTDEKRDVIEVAQWGSTFPISAAETLFGAERFKIMKETDYSKQIPLYPEDSEMGM